MRTTSEILETIEQIDPVEWDRLVHGQPFANWNWLALTEAVLVDHQPRYVLLRQDGNLRAGAVCALHKRFESRFLQSTLGWLPRYFPVLRCGVPISYDRGLFFSMPEQMGPLLPELFRNLQILLRRERVSLHSFDHLSPGDPLWDFLQERGYHRVAHLIETTLDIRWRSFEDYLKSLTSKKRKEYWRMQGHLEREGTSISIADALVEDQAQLHRLVKNVFQRHGEPVLYHEDLFTRASALMGENFKLIVARQAGQPVGCMALLRSGNEWIAKWPGLDYQRTLNTGTYYGLLAECVRQAIQAGGTRLRLGATAYQTKQHFGVTVEERTGAIAISARPLHWLAGKLLNLTANPEIAHPTAGIVKNG